MPETRKKTKPEPAVDTFTAGSTDGSTTGLPPAQEPRKPKIGRPSKYTPELAEEICQRLSEGEPLRQICRDDHMPAWQKIYEWMQKDPNLSGAIARAREVGQDAIAEDILRELNDEPERILSEGGGRIDSGYVQLLRTRADIKLKLLAKWNPKRYGDRVELAGDKDNPLQINAQVEAKTLFSSILENLELKKQANQ